MTDLGDVLESVLPHRVMYFQSNFFILHAFHIHTTSGLVSEQALGLVSETLLISKKWATTCVSQSLPCLFQRLTSYISYDHRDLTNIPAADTRPTVVWVKNN